MNKKKKAKKKTKTKEILSQKREVKTKDERGVFQKKKEEF